MDDLLSLSDIPDTQDRQAIELWLDTRAIELANLIASEILRITTEAFEDFIASVDESTVTASGDLYTIDSIIPKWQIVAETKVVPQITQTYLAGSLFAYTIADGKKSIPVSEASAWANVVNQQAVQYAAQASNRLRNVGETLWNDVRKKVTKSIASGASGETLKQEIESLSNFSEYRADTIGRTETAIAYSNGNWVADQTLGEFGPVEKVWVAVGDARTRANHLAAMSASEANPVPFNEPFNVGGVQMMYPHAPSAPAKEVVNCRCFYETYYVGDTRPDGSIVGGKLQPVAMPEPETEIVEDIVEEVTVPVVQATPSLPPGDNFSSQIKLPTVSRGVVKDRADNLQEMLTLLDDLHRLPQGKVPDTAVKISSSKTGSNGIFSPATNGPKPRRMRGMPLADYAEKIKEWYAKPRTPEIVIKATNDIDNQAFTFVHELGHRLDWDAEELSKNGYRSRRFINSDAVKQLKSKHGTEWMEFADEIDDSEIRSFVQIMRLARDSESIKKYVAGKSISHRQYFTSVEEVWARAYSQWVADVTRNPKLVNALQRRMKNSYQFSDDEFALIRPHIETILKARGLM